MALGVPILKHFRVLFWTKFPTVTSALFVIHIQTLYIRAYGKPFYYLLCKIDILYIVSDI